MAIWKHIDNIHQIRRETIKKLIKVAVDCVKPCSDGVSTTECVYKEAACDALIYGSLLHGLQFYGLGPNTEPDTYQLSLEDLAAEISALKVHVYPPSQSPYDRRNHSKCFTTNMKKEVETIMAGIEDPILESHIRHMEVQSAKLNGSR